MKYILPIIVFFLPYVTFAQLTYTSLVNVPVTTGSGFEGYINSIYALSISIAALLAVIKIIIAGVKWMTTDIVTSKGDAKRDIQGALVGLLIVLSAVLIISVINPSITDVDTGSLSMSTPPPGVPPPPPPTPAETFCADVQSRGGVCASRSCEYFATDYWITWLVNDPINRGLCSTFCSGEVIGRDLLNEGICFYEAGESEANEILLQNMVATLSSGDTYTVNCSESRWVGCRGYECVDPTHTERVITRAQADDLGYPDGGAAEVLECTIP